mgnify:FL=1
MRSDVLFQISLFLTIPGDGDGHGGSMHSLFSTRETWGHFFLPQRSKNRRVLMATPTPQVVEHSDHSPKGDVSQKASVSSTSSESGKYWKGLGY